MLFKLTKKSETTNNNKQEKLAAVDIQRLLQAGRNRRRGNPIGRVSRSLKALTEPEYSIGQSGSPIPPDVTDKQLRDNKMLGVGRTSKQLGDFAADLGGMLFGKNSKPYIDKTVTNASSSALGAARDWLGWSWEQKPRETIRDLTVAANPGADVSQGLLDRNTKALVNLANNNKAKYGLSEIAPAVRELSQYDPTIKQFFAGRATPKERAYARDKVDKILMASRIMGAPPAKAVQALQKRLGNLSYYTGDRIANLVRQQQIYDKGFYS